MSVCGINSRPERPYAPHHTTPHLTAPLIAPHLTTSVTPTTAHQSHDLIDLMRHAMCVSKDIYAARSTTHTGPVHTRETCPSVSFDKYHVTSAR
mmetsp:Transcript_4628/g.12356  ORF Transcript_4628/g.12356 Transcript_4628/m.12356 type:complete len:94 (+) Transcript_4628:117-398(+)